MTSVLIGSDCYIEKPEIMIVMSLSKMLDKSYIVRTMHEGKCLVICGGNMLRTAVVLRDGTIVLTPVTAKTIHDRMNATIEF